jgi:hypothetical protein
LYKKGKSMKGTQAQGNTNAQPSGAQQQPNDIYGGAAQAAQGQGQANYQQPQGAPVGGGGNRPIGAAALFSRGAGLNQGLDGAGRDLGELTKKLQDFYDKEKQAALSAWNVRIIPMPREGMISGSQSNLSNKIAMIVIVADQGDNRYAYHTLLLASDMAPAPATRSNDLYGGSYGQDRVAAPRTPVALADEALATIIRQRVTSLLPQAQVFSADWTTVPAEFKIDDTYKIASLFMNALRACHAELEIKSPNFRYASLADVAADSSALLVNSIHFNQDQANPPLEVFDAAGLPIRGEIVTDFRSEQTRQGNQKDGTENTAGVMEIGRTLAYVTVNIDPVQARRNRYMVGGPTPGINDTQEYVGEITMSGFDMGVQPDLGNMLLQISTMLPLLDQQTYGPQWLRNFMPAHLQSQGGRREHFRPRDLGPLNYDYGLKLDGNQVLQFPTTSPEFGIEEFYRLVGMIMQPAPALSIDVPMAGADTWFLRAFAEATEVEGARQAIINAMDALTDGRFSQIFLQTQSKLIVLPQSERVLNGYYTDDQGRVRDLRTIDGLYLMNAKGHEDPTLMKRWAGTWGGSTDYQLAERLKLIELVVLPKVTGVSVHKTFHPDFLHAMDVSFSQTGLKPKVDIPNADDRMVIRPSYGLASAGALATNFHTTMFTTGPAYTGSTAGYRGMTHNRVY